jgi:hypothetical protein
MKYWGIALLLIQAEFIYSAITDLAMMMYGVSFLPGIIGVILLIVAGRKKVKSNTKVKYDEDD